MYGVSNDYKTAIAAGSRIDRITGTITLADASTVAITDAVIAQGSLSIDDRCIPGSDIDIGAVEASEMRIGLLLDDDLEGAIIELAYGLDIGSGVFEDVPLGKWFVVECPRQNNIVRVLAADGMVLLEEDIGTPPASGSPYDYLAYACTTAGVTLKNTEAAIDALPNGTLIITYPAESEIETLRDLVMWVTCLLSGFAWFNRDGDLEIKLLTGASVRTIADDARDNTNISDIVKTITSVATTSNGAGYEQAATPDDGGIVVMDDNPLIRGESGATIGTILTAILGEVDGISYRPFQTELLRNDIALEPGDLVTLTGGVAGAGTACLITHSHWAYRGKQALEGAGRDSIVGAIRTQEEKKTVIKANKAYLTEIFSEQIRAGKKVIVGDETAEHFDIFIDSTDGDKPKIDSYDPANTLRASWHFEGLDFLDGAGARTRIATTTADTTLTVGVGQMFATIQAAIDSLPVFVNHIIIIEAYDGTYSEDVVIQGFMGTGSLTVQGHSGDIVNVSSFLVSDCVETVSVVLRNMTVTTTSQTAIKIILSYAVCLNITITASAADQHGIDYSAATGQVDNCAVSNRITGVVAHYSPKVLLYNVSGTGNVYGIDSYASTIYDMYGNTITGTTPRVTVFGGIITDPEGDQFAHFPKCVSRQDNTDNNVASSQLIKMGWGYIPGAAANSITEVITFDEAFDDVPIIMVCSAGFKPGADGAPANSGDFTNNGWVFAETRFCTATNFRIYLVSRDAATNFSATNNYAYRWIAIGTKAR
jgi:hypothetical protein